MLELQLDLLEAAVHEDITNRTVAEFALAPDPEGIGEASSLRR